MTLVPVTEASLKRAMRDPRYWQAGHPERNDSVGWVTSGWDSLGAAAPGGRMSSRHGVRPRLGTDARR